jgi:hypothetical protein
MSENLPPGYVHPPDEIDVIPEDELRGELRRVLFRLNSANAAIEVLQRAEQSAVSEADSMRSRLQKALGLLRTALLYNQGRRETWIDEANALVVEKVMPPDHQKMDTYGDCKCRVCRPELYAAGVETSVKMTDVAPGYVCPGCARPYLVPSE